MLGNVVHISAHKLKIDAASVSPHLCFDLIYQSKNQHEREIWQPALMLKERRFWSESTTSVRSISWTDVSTMPWISANISFAIVDFRLNITIWWWWLMHLRIAALPSNLLERICECFSNLIHSLFGLFQDVWDMICSQYLPQALRRSRYSSNPV